MADDFGYNHPVMALLLDYMQVLCEKAHEGNTIALVGLCGIGVLSVVAIYVVLSLVFEN